MYDMNFEPQFCSASASNTATHVPYTSLPRALLSSLVPCISPPDMTSAPRCQANQKRVIVLVALAVYANQAAVADWDSSEAQAKRTTGSRGLIATT